MKGGVNLNEVNIGLVTMRDLSYVVSNLRKLDREELFCKYPYEDDVMNGKILLEAAFRAGDLKRIATLGGQPVAVFGMQEVSPRRFKGWAFGTDRMRRVVPRITRYIRSNFIPYLELYANRIEAESLATHVEAHRWLESLGSVGVLRLRKVGKSGEDFILFERVF